MKILSVNVIERLVNKVVERPMIIPALSGAIFMLLMVNGLFWGAAILFVFMLLALVYSSHKLRIVCIVSLLFVIYLLSVLYRSGFFIRVDENINIENTIFKVESIEDRLNGTSRVILYNPIYGRVMLNTYVVERPVLFSELNVNGKLVIPDSPSNPGEFNYNAYLRNKGIKYVFKGDICARSDTPLCYAVYDNICRCVYEFKSIIIQRFDNQALAAAMFLGDTSLLDKGTKDQFQEGNLSHLLAVSGTHFSGFMAMVPFVFSKIRDRKVKGTSFFIFVGLIVVMTGATASVVRAAFISCCSFISRDKISGISIAIIILGLISPFTLVSIGFLMSFILCISIITLSGFIEAKITNHLTTYYSGTISVIIAAQIGMIPFWTLLSPKIGLVRLLLQFVASFIAQICCTIFIPSMILTKFSSLFIMPCDLLIGLINYLAQVTSRTPFVVNTRSLSIIVSLSVLAISLAVFLPLSVIKSISTKATALLMVMSFALGGVNYFMSPVAKVVFIDVGQGDSILIISKGTSLLIDGGAYDKGETVEKVLDYYGIDVLTYTVVTHWDEDHCGGIRYLFEQGRTDIILASYPDSYINDVNLIKSGDCLTVGDAELLCINPLYRHDESNDNSVVLELIYNDIRMLFTGDIPIEIEAELEANDLLHDVDILKVAHHGSKYSTSKEFLDVIKPEYAVVSVGKYNDYGHPSDEVIKRLDGVKIYETDKSGAIIVDIYNDRYEISSYRSQAIITKDSNV